MIIELLLVVGVKSACVCNPVWQRTHLSMPSESDLRLGINVALPDYYAFTTCNEK